MRRCKKGRVVVGTGVVCFLFSFREVEGRGGTRQLQLLLVICILACEWEVMYTL